MRKLLIFVKIAIYIYRWIPWNWLEKKNPILFHLFFRSGTILSKYRTISYKFRLYWVMRMRYMTILTILNICARCTKSSEPLLAILQLRKYITIWSYQLARQIDITISTPNRTELFKRYIGSEKRFIWFFGAEYGKFDMAEKLVPKVRF